jgi:nucleoside-triphosphatase
MSAPSNRKILLTGLPGCGKTTLIKTVVGMLKQPVNGFFTEEIRQHDRRVGFEVRTFGQPVRQGVLARTDIKSKYRVGQYGVDIDTFESIVLPEIQLGLQLKNLLVIDEIGKMELYSSSFKDMLITIFEKPISLLATISYKPQPFCDRLKSYAGVELIEVDKFDKYNRNILAETIVSKLNA